MHIAFVLASPSSGLFPPLSLSPFTHSLTAGSDNSSITTPRLSFFFLFALLKALVCFSNLTFFYFITLLFLAGPFPLCV